MPSAPPPPFDFELPTVDSIRALARGGPKRRFVFVTVPDGDPFDLIAPVAVLREANYFLEVSGRPDLAYEFEVVTNQPGSVFRLDGLDMVVDKACYDVQGNVDTVVFQAVDGEGRCLRDERFIAWVRDVSKRARRMATACVGTYVLAEAGLLDGRRATTHWCACGDFRRRYPKVLMDGDPIYVKDGKYYTSAGITSILDLLVALVEEDFGSELALRVAQGMVMFLRRPASQSQFSVPLTALKTDDRRIRKVVSHVVEHTHDELTVERLGELAGMSPRNFARIFSREIGMTPGKFVELARLEYARRQLEQSRLSINQIAAESGYRTADGMRLAFDRNLGVTPREYRLRFASSA